MSVANGIELGKGRTFPDFCVRKVQEMKTAELKGCTEKYQLLDVRLADDFAAGCLEGALNNCVFEIAFGGRLAESAPDKTLLTIVYGANDRSREAAMALEKLERLGYSDVRILSGGFLEASKEFPMIQGTPLVQPPAPPHGHYELDLKESYLRWTGRNLISKHTGRLGIEKGEFLFEEGALVGGSVVIDMNDITCDDLAATDLHDVLISHLKDHDFFDVGVYPTAEVTIKKADESKVWVDLTLKGITQEVVIPILPGLTEAGLLATQASFSIDRTRWNVLYGSQKFFKRLAGHFVSDWLEIELRLLTRETRLVDR